MKPAVLRTTSIATLFLPFAITTGCGAIQTHRQLEQPLGAERVSGVGGTLFRLNKLGDLPNAFGGRGIWGGKVDKGFAEVRLAGIEDQTLLLDVIDVNRHSSETTMDKVQAVSATRSRQLGRPAVRDGWTSRIAYFVSSSSRHDEATGDCHCWHSSARLGGSGSRSAVQP